jgi:hypothetical protein
VASDNPGSAASHRIPVTFEVRPTNAKLALAGAVPDELLIDWAGLPEGSSATLYLPGASAPDIVSRADALYTAHRLVAVDQHTLTCPASGMTYLPIPDGQQVHMPGLLTVDLPASVRKGQGFSVVVRQLTNAVTRTVTPPPEIGAGAGDADAGAADGASERLHAIRFRRVIGSFQISIPVSVKAQLLDPEIRLLGVLKWIQLSIPETDRWFDVFARYVATVADRVRALGGDPDAVEPDPHGRGKHDDGHHGGGGHDHGRDLRGKVVEVRFDCAGDFTGFVLWCCGHRHHVASSREGVKRLLLEAMHRSLTVSVQTDQHDEICVITIHG